MYSEQLSQQLSFCDVLNITNINNGAYNTIGVDMSKFRRVLFVIVAHGLNAAGLIDARLQSASAAAFSTPVNMTGTNITQISKNYTVTTIEVRGDQVVQQNAGHRYVRCNITGSGNALNATVLAFGDASAQKPASQFDLNTSYLNEKIVCNT